MSEKSLFNDNKIIKKINVARVDAHDVHVLDADYEDFNDQAVSINEIADDLQEDIDKESFRQQPNSLHQKEINISNREHDRKRKRNDDKTKKPQRQVI